MSLLALSGFIVLVVWLMIERSARIDLESRVSVLASALREGTAAADVGTYLTRQLLGLRSHWLFLQIPLSTLIDGLRLDGFSLGMLQGDLESNLRKHSQRELVVTLNSSGDVNYLLDAVAWIGTTWAVTFTVFGGRLAEVFVTGPRLCTRAAVDTALVAALGAPLDGTPDVAIPGSLGALAVQPEFSGRKRWRLKLSGVSVSVVAMGAESKPSVSIAAE